MPKREQVERFLDDHRAQLADVMQRAAALEKELNKLSETAFALKGAIAALQHVLDLPTET